MIPLRGADDLAAASPPKWVDHTSPWLGSAARPENEVRRKPFRIFDNVYYVGLNWVSSYLVTTSDGLVLLDATYGDTVDQVLTNIRELGFDPANIGTVIISHGHADHFGGAGRIHEISGARVVLSAADWDAVLQQQAAGRPRTGVALQRDYVANDDGSLVVGDTTFHFYLSPGHTAGSLTVTFDARDGDKSYRVLCPGGLGFNFGPAWTAIYIKSYERLKELGPWDVVLANHPHMGARDLLDIEKELAARQPGAPHPAAVGPAAVNAWIDRLLVSAHDKLAFETAHPAAKE